MSKHLPNFVIAMVLAALSTAAEAQLIKCKDAGGKVTYTDRGCPSNTVSESRISGNPNVIEAPEVRRALAARQQAEADAALSAGAPSGGDRFGAGSPASDPAADARRVRELQMTLNSLAAGPERKRAAREELDRIHRGNTNRLTAAEQQQAARLQTDLSSIDDDKRRKAERQLRSLNDTYESQEFLENRARAEAERRQRIAAENAAAQAAANAAAAQANAAAAQANAHAARQVFLNGRPMVPAAGGFVDPRGGTFYQGVAGGYVNSQTGQFVPKP